MCLQVRSVLHIYEHVPALTPQTHDFDQLVKSVSPGPAGAADEGGQGVSFFVREEGALPPVFDLQPAVTMLDGVPTLHLSLAPGAFSVKKLNPAPKILNPHVRTLNRKS